MVQQPAATDSAKIDPDKAGDTEKSFERFLTA